jgi:CTP synthase
LRNEVGRENVFFIHVTWIPYIGATGELKTKPTQHSVKELREIGIQPDILICRSEKVLGREIRAKIALFCNVHIDSVIEETDVENSIYEVPLMLSKGGVDERIIEKLKLKQVIIVSHDQKLIRS